MSCAWRPLLSCIALASGAAGCQALLDFAPSPVSDAGDAAVASGGGPFVVEVFAQVSAGARLLAMNGSSLYVVGDDQKIVRVSKTTRVVEPQQAPTVGMHGGPLTFEALGADDRWLFLSAREDHLCGAPATVWRSPTGDAGAFARLGGYCSRVTAMAHDAVDVTFTVIPGLGGQQLFELPHSSSGAPAMVVDNLPAINAMVSTPDAVYAASDGTKRVLKVPKAGDAGVDFAITNASPKDIVADATDVYWVEADGRIARKPLGASASDLTVDVAKVTGGVQNLAQDANALYFTNVATGRVETVAKSGGAAVLIADQQAEPLAIVADDTAVYWVNRGNGTLMRAKR